MKEEIEYVLLVKDKVNSRNPMYVGTKKQIKELTASTYSAKSIKNKNAIKRGDIVLKWILLKDFEKAENKPNSSWFD